MDASASLRLEVLNTSAIWLTAASPVGTVVYAQPVLLAIIIDNGSAISVPMLTASSVLLMLYALHALVIMEWMAQHAHPVRLMAAQIVPLILIFAIIATLSN